jgi:hypothetical protein
MKPIPGYIDDEFERAECGHLAPANEINEAGDCVNCAADRIEDLHSSIQKELHDAELLLADATKPDTGRRDQASTCSGEEQPPFPSIETQQAYWLTHDEPTQNKV